MAMQKQFVNVASSSKQSTKNKIPSPEGLNYYPYQIEGINQMAQQPHSLLADEMGLGKTIQAIGVINKLVLRSAIIVCPASVKLQWQRELQDWLVHAYDTYIVSTRAEHIPPANIIIVNYDLLIHSNILNQLRIRTFDLLVCDEAHRLKNMKSQRTKAVLSKKGIANNCFYKIMITGTPILNRPVELYPILKTLSPKTIDPYTHYDSYAKRFCGGYYEGFSMIARGSSNQEDLNKRLRAGFMIRRLEKDVLPQIPPIRYKMIFIENKKFKKILSVVDEADRKSFKHVDHGLDVGELATMRRDLALEKVKETFDYILEAADQAGKLVLFTYHRDVAKYLMQRLSDEELNPVVFMGGLTSKQKDTAVNTFINDDKCKVFIGQINSAGQGVDGLQTVCHHVLFLEWSWVPGEVSQAIKRVHRNKQKKSTLVQFVIWKDSLEEHMMRVALDKLKNIRKTVD